MANVADRVTKWATENAAAVDTDSIRLPSGSGLGSLSMGLFNAHCGGLVTSLQTGGFSRGKH